MRDSRHSAAVFASRPAAASREGLARGRELGEIWFARTTGCPIATHGVQAGMSGHTRALCRLSAVVLLTVVLDACSSPELPDVWNAVAVAAQCEGSGESRYFPADMFRWLPKGTPASEWTRGPSQMLEAMREPSLACGAAPESYRILWIHSFSSWPPTVSKWPPTMIRMSRSSDGWSVTAAQLAGSVNRKEVMRYTRTLSNEESREMLAAVSEFGLWNRKDFAINVGVDDGEMWVVEGRRGTGYHPALLVNADREAIRKLAIVFLEMAGIKASLLNGSE
jgi:hypothetical protein